MAYYEVIAGTVGVVYSGDDPEEAKRVYDRYAAKAREEAEEMTNGRDPRRLRHAPVRIRRSRRPAVSRRVRELVKRGYSPSYATKLAYHGRDPAKARKYYVVDQEQGGLWQQVGKFYSREDAERFRARVPGRTRIVHTYPSYTDTPVAADRARRRSRRDLSSGEHQYAVTGYGDEADWGTVIEIHRSVDHPSGDAVTVRWQKARATYTDDRDKLLLYSSRNAAIRAYQRRYKSQGRARDPRVSAAKRRSLRPSQFALPERRALPIHDAKHAANAASRLSQMHTRGTITEREYRKALSRVRAAEQRFGVGKARGSRRSRGGRRRDPQQRAFATRYIVVYEIPAEDVEDEIAVVAFTPAEAKRSAKEELRYTKGARIMRVIDTEESPWVE